MIDIRNGELADLWPDETSPEFKSISYALHMAIIRMLEKAAGVGSSCDIDHLAESTLDYLAVETRAMYYDQGADIETKRSIIKNTLKWYTSRNSQSNRGTDRLGVRRRCETDRVVRLYRAADRS